MKVFFYYAGTPSAVFESELELIRKHEIAGDNVRVLQCSGNLPNCHWNLEHENNQCNVCSSRFKNGWEWLNPGENVELKQFPAVSWLDPETVPDFESVDEICKFQHDQQNLGYGVAASLVSLFRDHKFDPRQQAKHVQRSLNTTVQIYDSLKREFETFQPDLVYYFNGRIATHLPAKILCKEMGIKFRSYELSQQENCYRIFENKTIHDVVSIEEVEKMNATWTVDMEEKGSSYLRQMRAGSDLGKLPVFTHDQTIGSIPEGFNPELRNIAIFNGTIDEYAGIENSKNKIYLPDETAGIARILEDFKSDKQFYFHLRIHPNMKGLPHTTTQLAAIKKLDELFSNLHVIWPENEVDSYALMEACEKVITFGSTTGIEATFWGIPSILADQARFENFGYAYTPNNHQELVALIQADLIPMPVASAVKIIYSVAYDGIPFEYFKEVRIENQLTMVTRQGKPIQANALPRFRLWIYCLPPRLKRIAANPLLIFPKLKIQIEGALVRLLGLKSNG